MSTGNFYQTNTNTERNNIPDNKAIAGGEDFYFNGDDSDDSSYASSSEEEDRLDRKVDEVNQLLGISYKKKSLNIIKRMVSRKKRRFVQDGCDLDLTCIILLNLTIFRCYPKVDSHGISWREVRIVLQKFNERCSGFLQEEAFRIL